MEEFPYQAVPVKDNFQGLGGLEIGLGVIGFIAISVLALKVYKIILKKYYKEDEDERSIYPPTDSYKEWENKIQERY